MDFYLQTRRVIPFFDDYNAFVNHENGIVCHKNSQGKQKE